MCQSETHPDAPERRDRPEGEPNDREGVAVAGQLLCLGGRVLLPGEAGDLTVG